MLSFRSADGTLLSAATRGAGPPLVLVHGIAGDAARWGTSRRLAESFTLHALDRRGRGASGDGPHYTLEREIEDVVALVERIGGDVYLLGHSFGGLLALEAASRTHIAKLLVYEPYAPAIPVPAPSATTESFFALAGDSEAILVRFLTEIVQMSASDVAAFRATPWWSCRLAAAPTIPREMAAVETHAAELAGLAARGTPTRFLLGERSPEFLREATSRFHAALPASDVVVLAGQAHIAMDLAPDVFEREVRSFFLGA